VYVVGAVVGAPVSGGDDGGGGGGADATDATKVHVMAVFATS
jgi:hypothetical protein